MNNNINKIKLPTTDSLSKPALLSRDIVNPKRDWNILIIFLAILVATSVFFDIHMYKTLVKEDMYISVDKTELTIEKLKSDDLEKILNNFKAKKSVVANLKLENLIDPSI